MKGIMKNNMSNDKQQTAVTYLSIQLSLLEMMRYNGGMTEIEYLKAKIKVIDEAREMEKEQMIDFANAYSAQDQYKISAKDYYKENYGGNK
jgi:hypothetical protein